MKINFTPKTLYFFSTLILLGFLIFTYFFYSRVNWSRFFAAAGIFLPTAVGISIAIILLFLGIYLAIKGLNHSKEKKHVRYL
ncbi:putative membrane protein [Pedobacter sp. AK013]|nr:putative membrane protein [Pedobacter sp. AK013]